jgi:dimethylaniline monooxygenase (N-oxide forming)
MNSNVKTIGIIGSGIGGLITAKTFLEEGFDCEIFERKSSLGGVWNDGYHSLHLQLSKESYELLDWPMPQSYPKYPSSDQILSYLNSYANHFRVFDKIHFNCNIEKLEPLASEQGWIVHGHDKNNHEDMHKEFDFVVVCNGLYSNPNIPSYPDLAKFKGRIFHSSDFHDPALTEGRKVVVIGFGKSALDTAEDIAQLSDDVTLVFRQPHWPLPRKFVGLISINYVLNRFTAAMLPLYQHPSKIERFLHTYAKALSWGFWRIIEILLRWQFKLKSSVTLPATPIELDLFTGDFIVSPNLYPLIHQGRIKTQQASIKRFTEHGIELSNGTHLDADTVIFGTGWKHDYSILAEHYQSSIENDGLYLYRHIICPDIPRLGFIGLVSTFNNSLSDYLEARWLVAMLKDEMLLPDKQVMLDEVEQMKEWKRLIIPKQTDRASLLQVHALHYHDELLGDLGIKHKRKKNAISEVFSGYAPSDYKDILHVYLKKKISLLPDDLHSHRLAGMNADQLEKADLSGLNLEGMDLGQKNLKGADLRRASLTRSNLSGANLENADISGADLSSAELFNSNLNSAVMSRVNLDHAFLTGAKLTRAYLFGANLSCAHLSGACLSGAQLNNAQLNGADLSGADLSGADLRGASMRGCDLSNSNLKGADLRGADLSGAILLSANFDVTDITGVKFDESETCKGIRIDSANGNALFKRFAKDQAYIEEFKIHKPFRHWLWKYSSNYGRSLLLWVFWCIFIAISFSLIFHLHLGGSESFLLNVLAQDPDYEADSWAPMLYYSVVTFTTLGFGDIVPKTQEAAWWIMSEVVLGYFMLGGLVSILATKLARRS